jgi:hypothetical protein
MRSHVVGSDTEPAVDQESCSHKLEVLRDGKARGKHLGGHLDLPSWISAGLLTTVVTILSRPFA